MIWCFLLVFLAAVFNSVMDSVENEHVNDTIFKRFHSRFWHKRDSWDDADKIFGYKLDAWHISKSAMIICLLSIIGLLLWIKPEPVISPFWDVILAGGLWNLIFVLFYKLWQKI